MEVKVQRIKNNGDTTFGEMFIDNVFQCYTLEDQPNPKKIYGETRIPAGRYEIKLRTVGTTHEDYKKRFPEFHKGTLHIQNVPDFKYVLIHIGNNDEDTLGCILVGERLDQQGWKLINSKIAYKKIYLQIAPELFHGRKVFITVVDEDA